MDGCGGRRFSYDLGGPYLALSWAAGGEGSFLCWGWGYNPAYVSGVGTERAFSTLAVRMGCCFSCPRGDDGGFLCLGGEKGEFLLMSCG